LQVLSDTIGFQTSRVLTHSEQVVANVLKDAVGHVSIWRCGITQTSTIVKITFVRGLANKEQAIIRSAEILTGIDQE